MHQGSLALLLHAHLPWVRHPEHEEFLEEDWLYEAITECYIPLLKMLRRMVTEKIPLKITFTLTPSLCAMLRDPLLQKRAERYLERGYELARMEIDRTANDAALNGIARHYQHVFRESLDFYQKEINRDIVGAFAQLQKDGIIEIITCAATHGFLPLMDIVPQAMRAQVLIGRDYHRECFGRDPEGIWLPECAYVPHIDGILQEANLRWFIADAHGLMYGEPRPRFAIYAPYFTPAGPAVFGRDRESSKQVWSAREGYPGDPAYRDFYRDIGMDLPEDYLHTVLPSTGFRRNTGFKYHRITGSPQKEIYNRGWAMAAADHHAWDFMQNRVRQIEHLRSMLPVEPIIVSPFDAELFGHWWYEGPQFLELFLRKAAYDPRISGVVVKIDPLQCGWGKIQEIRRHVEMFRQSGKWAVAYLERAGEKEYFLATAFGEIYAPPSASLSLRGLAVTGTFLRGVLDKVGVEPEIRRIGKFKSAGDQLLRKDMSGEFECFGGGLGKPAAVEGGTAYFPAQLCTSSLLLILLFLRKKRRHILLLFLRDEGITTVRSPNPNRRSRL